MNRLEILGALYPYAQKYKSIGVYYDFLMDGTYESDLMLSRLEEKNFANAGDLMGFVATEITEMMLSGNQPSEDKYPMEICLN